MVNIAQSTVRANIYETVYDLLTSSLSTGTVTAAFIDDAPTFPQVVINPSSISVTKLTFLKDNRSYEAEVEIDLYVKKNKQIDQISDEITADLYSNESSLTSDGLYLQDIEDSNEDTFFLNEQKIHTKTLNVSFKVNI